MSKNVKKIAGEFIKKYSLTKINYDTLTIAAEDIGYTIIEFNNVFNDEDVEAVIQNLNIKEITLRSRGFTYADSNYRLIFINEALDKEEKCLVLSHEIGHIVCCHFTANPIIGNDVREEHEANEFSHYLLNQSVFGKCQVLIATHRKKTATVVSIFIVFAIIASFGIYAEKARSYYGDYYVTPTGTKYHKKECIYVKDKTTAKRLTKEEFEAGKYEACKVCLPDK